MLHMFKRFSNLLKRLKRLGQAFAFQDIRDYDRFQCGSWGSHVSPSRKWHLHSLPVLAGCLWNSETHMQISACFVAGYSSIEEFVQEFLMPQMWANFAEHCQQILLGECAKPGSSFKIQHAQTCPTNRHRQKGLLLLLLLLLLSHRIHGIVVLGVAFSVTAKNNICSKTPFPWRRGGACERGMVIPGFREIYTPRYATGVGHYDMLTTSNFF